MDTTSITDQVALKSGIYLEQRPETVKPVAWPSGFRWFLKREDMTDVDVEASSEVHTFSVPHNVMSAYPPTPRPRTALQI